MTRAIAKAMVKPSVPPKNCPISRRSPVNVPNKIAVFNWFIIEYVRYRAYKKLFLNIGCHPAEHLFQAG